MSWESLGEVGNGQMPNDEEWILFCYELAKNYLLHICGNPPEGCELDVFWQDHDYVSYPSLGLYFEYFTVDSSKYWSICESALESFNLAVDWSAIRPDWDAEEVIKIDDLEVDHLNEGLMLLELCETGDSFWHEAIQHFEGAAKEGDIEAMFILGKELVEYAQNAGAKNDENFFDDNRKKFRDGVLWLETAANNNDIEAIIELAYMFENREIDDGNPPDLERMDYSEQIETALNLYEKAYALDRNDNYLEAINRIEGKLVRLSNLNEEASIVNN